ncbi:hypothetical protein DBV15_08149 [Temnothorax longispinosus]|uniref:Uncharacterized protein n=1 Tax=Temnothorax longispinosus TaxID=300112 RepID=A0A4S2L1Q4_9HYME|nr:hypothetical protein DBV15_08149 [Temnothorax longispinosus]
MEGQYIQISSFIPFTSLLGDTRTSGHQARGGPDQSISSDFNRVSWIKRRPDAPILHRAYRYLNNDEARSIPYTVMSNYELASSRNDTIPSHVKRRKGKREREGERGGGRGRSESLFSLLYAERDQSRRACLLPATTSLRAHFTTDTGGCGGDRGRDREASRGTGAVEPRRRTTVRAPCEVGKGGSRCHGKGDKRSRGNQARHVGVLDVSLPPNIPVWLRPSRSNGRQTTSERVRYAEYPKRDRTVVVRSRDLSSAVCKTKQLDRENKRPRRRERTPF